MLLLDRVIFYILHYHITLKYFSFYKFLSNRHLTPERPRQTDRKANKAVNIQSTQI